MVPGAWAPDTARASATLAIPACVAIPFGASMLGQLPEIEARRAIAGLVLVMVVLLASGFKRHRPLSGRIKLLAGSLSGFLSGFAGIGGPPIVLLLLSGPAAAARNRSMLILFFAATQVVTTLVFAVRGWIDADVLWSLAILSPERGGDLSMAGA